MKTQEYRVAGLPAHPSKQFGWDRVDLPNGTTTELMLLHEGNHTRVLYDQIAKDPADRADGYYLMHDLPAARIWHVDLPAGVLRTVVQFNGPDFGLPPVVTFRTEAHRDAWTAYLVDTLQVQS